MIILDDTNRSLEVVLDVAPSTEFPLVASYVEVTTAAYTPGSTNTVTNGSTAVTVVAAPATATQRQVKLLTVVNVANAARTCTVQYNAAGTARKMFVVTLAVGDILVYTDGEGFRIYDANGNLKQTSGGSGSHNVLDGSIHGDTTAGTVTRGDVIVGNATPKWSRLAKGAANTYLKSDGTDVSYVDPAATQAEMEAAASNTVFATPGRTQYHPGAAKAWVNFDGTASPATIRASHNVSSITDNGTGDWSVNLTTAFSTANYGISTPGGESDNATRSTYVFLNFGNVPTASVIRVYGINASLTALEDVKFVCVTVHGDQ